jgi:tripartite-type tricarboxylate transporter receptor subunit TctC
MKRVVALLALALLGSGIECAVAQKYPIRPIRLVVASSPGGASDILARLLAQKLGDELGQQVVVDNRGGASGVIGTGIVAKATPDGYTLLIIQPSLTINPSMIKKMPYDAVRDFAPVSLVVDAFQIMTVNPSVPARSVKDLIALAKTKPGELTFGSPGIGTSPHMTAELFKQTAGVDMPQSPPRFPPRCPPCPTSSPAGSAHSASRPRNGCRSCPTSRPSGSPACRVS